MFSRNSSYFGLLLALAVAACGAEGEPILPGGEGANPTTRERLARPVELLSVADDSGAQLIGRYTWDGERATYTDLQVMGGRLVASSRPDGSLVLEDFALDLDDVVLPPEAGPLGGVHLTGIRVYLDGSASAPTGWSETAMEGFGSATVTLKLDWALLDRDGEVLPLATQTFEDVELDLYAYTRIDGKVAVSVSAHKPGVFWRWGGVVELRDLSFQVTLVGP